MKKTNFLKTGEVIEQSLRCSMNDVADTVCSAHRDFFTKCRELFHYFQDIPAESWNELVERSSEGAGDFISQNISPWSGEHVFSPSFRFGNGGRLIIYVQTWDHKKGVYNWGRRPELGSAWFDVSLEAPQKVYALYQGNWQQWSECYVSDQLSQEHERAIGW